MLERDSKTFRMTGRLLSHIALGMVLISSACAAQTQSAYPSRPVRLVVPSAPGGNADLLGRIIAQKLSDVLGQQVVPDNRPGAVVGFDIVAKAAPDGYTLLFPSTTHAINPGLYKLPFDPLRDFAAVSLVGSTPLIISVTPELPARTVRELVALAKASPGQLNYASVGGPTHLAGVLFNSMTGVKIEHVPYRGQAQAFPDLINGRVQLMYPSATSILPYVKGGKVRALAITSRQRSALAPDLTTAAEAGLPGYEAGIWNGIIAPARTPPAVIARLHAALATIIKAPDVRDRIIGLGADPMSSTPAQFDAFIAAEIKKWTQVIRDAGIRPE